MSSKCDFLAGLFRTAKLLICHLDRGKYSRHYAGRAILHEPLPHCKRNTAKFTARWISVSCLDKQVSAVCDQIRSVDKSRLRKSAGSLSSKDLQALDDALRQVLAL
ncbi:MAG: type II toxin-antitoxin system PemK/MazF family toxin [Gammaproteobacteria bacterium]|nr:type II toxin-antitoxin system PemK/MazF family toxin [Gammaproteobacteria bacterium]